MKLKIFTAVVAVGPDPNLYVALSESDLQDQLAFYCRQYWEEEMETERPPPEDSAELIEEYFDSRSPHGETVEYEEFEHPFEIFTDRELATTLAALRCMQHSIDQDGIESVENMDHFHDGQGVIALRPLDSQEIDDFCERLNSGTSPAAETASTATPTPE